MSDPLYLRSENRTTNEPKVHPLIKGSFLFVPSSGMRSAPEELVLELMREIFFEQHFGETTTKARPLKPEEQDDNNRPIYSDRERAVLYALRGRRKQTKQHGSHNFFAPAYPQLAHRGWLRKESDRVVKSFLLSGPVAQHIWHSRHESKVRKGEFIDPNNRQGILIEKVRGALVGKNSCFNEELSRTELLSATLGPESFDGYANNRWAEEKLLTKTMNLDSLLDIENDELADQIANDLEAICDLEAEIPRMQWLQLLMTFLRLALPVWQLAQMQVTRLFHGWLLMAVDDGIIVDQREVAEALAGRNRGILHPTLTPTRELFEHTDRYMKCRVELDILLYCLEEVREEQIRGKSLKLEREGSKVLGVEELFVLARDASDEIRNTEQFREVTRNLDLDVRTFLTREGERFSGWRLPRVSGTGKNIDEFFRVMYRAAQGDEAGGHLVTPVGEQAKRGFEIFPGQMLLKTMTYLAAKCKYSNRSGEGGILVLQDIEDHFAKYGIDFSTAADARPRLMRELQAMGLLKGSPDAGSSVKVQCPYEFRGGD